MNGLFRNRYGFDRLNIFLGIFSLLFLFSRYLWPIAALLLIYMVFRASSRNFTRRQLELRKYEIFIGRLGDFFERLFRPVMNRIQNRKNTAEQKKIYKFVKCIYCRKKLRLPKHKGKIKVTCPECKNQFIIKT